MVDFIDVELDLDSNDSNDSNDSDDSMILILNNYVNFDWQKLKLNNEW